MIGGLEDIAFVPQGDGARGVVFPQSPDLVEQQLAVETKGVAGDGSTEGAEHGKVSLHETIVDGGKSAGYLTQDDVEVGLGDGQVYCIADGHNIPQASWDVVDDELGPTTVGSDVKYLQLRKSEGKRKCFIAWLYRKGRGDWHNYQNDFGQSSPTK